MTEQLKPAPGTSKVIGGIAIGLTIAFAGVAAWSMFFKKATVLGTVIDKATWLPLAGIKVELDGTDGIFLETVTDINGEYKFKDAARTSYSFQGYTYLYYYTLTFTSGAYQTVVVADIPLHPAGNYIDIQLEAV